MRRSFESCLAEALNHRRVENWRQADEEGYLAAKRRGWLTRCCQHMPPAVWTIELCLEDAAQFTSIQAWRTFSNNAYRAAKRKGWLDYCAEILVDKRYVKRSSHHRWTLAQCQTDASHFNHRAICKRCSGAYKAAWRFGWLDACCGHMKSQKTYWTLALCKLDALKYTSRGEWNENSTAYKATKRNDWLDAHASAQKPLDTGTMQGRCS